MPQAPSAWWKGPDYSAVHAARIERLQADLRHAFLKPLRYPQVGV
jgi:hypothetical protein